MCQVESTCHFSISAPFGCLQYFTGASGTVTSYAYASGTHLADQNYLNCIRREQGHCTISWSHAPDSFQLDGFAGAALADPTLNFGGACSRDYVLIPGGRGVEDRDSADRYCGDMLVQINLNAAPLAPGTVLSKCLLPTEINRILQQLSVW